MKTNNTLTPLVQSMIKENHNDYDLGFNLRKEKNVFSDLLNDDIYRKYPNNFELGKQVRQLYKN
jgi:hypothetical protein